MTDQGPNNRKTPRSSFFLTGTLMNDYDQSLGKIIVRNFSETGLMAKSDARLIPDLVVIASINGHGIKGKVAWCRDGSFGMIFDESISPTLIRQHVGNDSKIHMPPFLRDHEREKAFRSRMKSGCVK